MKFERCFKKRWMEEKSQMWPGVGGFFVQRKRSKRDFLPVLGVPGEVGLSVAPLGFAEVAGSDLVSRANLWKEDGLITNQTINQPVNKIIKWLQ